MKRIIGLALLSLLVAMPNAFAQVAGGNIYGVVSDESGAALPGAVVTLGGPFSQTTTTGDSGQFRFLSLPADTYELTVALGGFTTIKREVIVTTNMSVQIPFTLKVAAVEETIEVVAETPVVDAKRFGTATTLTKAELAQIPNSRDPWAVLRTIPGVVLDRVNIAGNESGQQSNFNAKGADSSDIMWNLDGVQIDDMAAAGATPTYFDYDAFEEFAVATGGNDVSMQTGSIGLNFVTKRGTNQWRGSIRGYLTHDDLQSSNIKGTELDGDPRLEGSDKADHIQQINDYGADLGGPILKDKLWVYGSYGKQDVRLVRTNQTADKTILTTYSAKLNWQISPDTQFSYLFFNGKKEKFGRDPGYGVQLEDGALWNQGNAYADFFLGGLHGMHKLELNHVFNPNFFLNVKYTNYDTGFGVTPRGGLDGTAVIDFDASTGHGPLDDYYTTRPLKNVTDVTGNYFTEGWGGNHELKFGFGYKKAEVSTSDIYGGNSGLFGYFYEPGLGGAYALVWRNVLTNYAGDFWYGYLSDTFTKDRLTLSAGLRWDYQKAVNTPSMVPGNGSFPDLVPGLDYQGGGVGIEWNDISPRVGVSYALDDARKTLLRANFSLYAAKLNTGATTWDNPVGYSAIAYLWDDANDDRRLAPEEVRLDLGIQYFFGLDPDNPTALENPDTIDANYKAPKDYEAIVGIEREILPDLAIGAAYTWRRSNDIRDWNRRIGLTSADYTPNDPVTENGYTAQTFSPDPDLVAATAGGRIKVNRPDYHRGYNGLELTMFKRLSNRWMARIAFAYMDHKEYYDGPGAVQTPTRSDTQGSAFGTAESGPQEDGGQWAERSGGSGKGDIFFNAKWQLTANALYELPAGFEVAAALFARQGFTRPIVLRLGAGDDGRLRAMGVPTLDTERYPDLWNLDLRLAKNFRIGDANLLLAADLFNVFNSNTTLNRIRQANSSTFNRLDEVLSPRILRVGVRFTF